MTDEQNQPPEWCPACLQFFHRPQKDNTPTFRLPECEATETDVELMTRMNAIKKFKARQKKYERR